jgi:membrane protein required for colicin V production
MIAPLATFSPSSLTSFDWILVAMVTLSTLFAFKSGLIRVFSSLVGLIVGTTLASRHFLQLATFLQRWVTAPMAAEVIAFAAILFGVVILTSLVAAVVRSTVKAVGLGFADRVLGALIGLLRGALLGAAVVSAMVAFLPHSGWLKQSRLAGYFLAEAHAVSFVVPQHFQEQLTGGAQRIREKKPLILNGDAPPQ